MVRRGNGNAEEVKLGDHIPRVDADHRSWEGPGDMRLWIREGVSALQSRSVFQELKVLDWGKSADQSSSLP
jgi:hypothetical protein